MTEHYYSANPTSAHRERTFSANLLGNACVFITDSGVFSRGAVDAGTELLIETLGARELSGKFLDLACGWGPVGIAMAKRDPRLSVTMTDINSRAVELARKNAAANGARADILCGDGLSALPSDFSVIAVNPPIRAGKSVIYRLFSECAAHLLPDGELFVVIRKQQGAPSAQKFLSGIFAECGVVNRSAGYWILRAFCPKPDSVHTLGDN